MALILVVEDAPTQRQNLTALLRAEGYETAEAESAEQARRLCRQRHPEVVLLDLGLPDTDGLDLLPELLRLAPAPGVVVLTGRDSVRDAVRALQAGARHYLVKPWEKDELLVIVAREARAAAFAENTSRSATDRVFWGEHPAMREVRARLDKLAGALQTTVLIEAETGTGKEVVARELHRLGRPDGPFVPLNCAAVPGELLEAELFGHERGAYTGAEGRRRGVVDLARDGTLFLDEIGEMAPTLQAKLLRFLEDYSFRRVGGAEELRSPCRVVAATNRNLEALVSEGRFRADLFYRLAVVRVRLPPLRERWSDILPLARWLSEELARTLGRAARPLSRQAEKALGAHAWPGNVRELRNRLERALVLGESQYIDPHDLDLTLPTGSACSRCGQSPCACAVGEGSITGAVGSSADNDEAARLQALLDEEHWIIARAARRLGIPRHQLKYRMAKHGLSKTEKG